METPVAVPLPGPATPLARLLELPILGGFLTLAVAAVPTLVLMVGQGVLGGAPGEGPVFGIGASMATAGWLVWLQRVQRVRICLPLVRIPLLWVMPVYLVANLLELFAG